MKNKKRNNRLTLYLTDKELETIKAKSSIISLSFNEYILRSVKKYPKLTVLNSIYKTKNTLLKKLLNELRENKDKKVPHIIDEIIDLQLEQIKSEGHDPNIQSFVTDFLERTRSNIFKEESSNPLL